MKLNMTVDCTPQELRDFLGWPDIGPVQQQMLERAAKTISDGGGDLDPVAMMRPFLTPNTQAMDAMQKAFLQAMQTGMGTAGHSTDKG